MKHIFLSLMVLLLLGMFASCKKHSSIPQFSSPAWLVDTSGKYPYSMTVVLQLPDSLQKITSGSDKLAAFINGECRGVGVSVTTGNTFVYYLLVKGGSSEQGSISFKYYNAGSSHMFGADDIVGFSADGNYGTADSPEKPDFTVIKKEP